MNILITGGTGYLGGRLAAYLHKKEPHSRILLTIKNRQKNVPSWAEQFAILHMNCLDEDSIKHCFTNRKIDCIIHLAALNEIESMKDPELAHEVNIKGTYRLLEYAYKNNVEKFIYCSTFHVYGDASAAVITEDTPAKPFHPYAITHRAAEDYVRFFQHYYGMKSLIIRLSNGYGYPMDREIDRWSLLFNDLCKQAVTTGRLVLKSSGKQYRDFISLESVARVVHYFLFVIPEMWADGLFNLGSGTSMSIVEAAQTIAQIYGKKYKCENAAIETGKDAGPSRTTVRFVYDIGKLKSMGIEPEDDMEKEVEKTMEVCEGFLTAKHKKHNNVQE
ncbi:MAG: NAD-dependent epimerase/dehydratase family protein [bacterium]